MFKANQGKIILISIVLAFFLGIVTPNLFHPLTFISTIFIRSLKMCALPIIATCLIITLGSVQEWGKFKIIARNSVLYIILTEIIAVTIGLVVFNCIDISHGIDGFKLLAGVNVDQTIVAQTTVDPNHIINYIFTDNIFESIVKFDVLPIVLFSILFGLACAFHPEKAKPILTVLISISDMFMVLLNGLMLMSPVAIFVLIGASVAESYKTGVLLQNLAGLMAFVGLFFFALFIHFLWQLLLVVMLYRKKLTLKKIFTEALPIFTTAFVSSSSLATLPIALEKAEKLGGNKKVIAFMLPICASMNFASGMMYEVTATLFFSQILGIHIDLIQQIFLAIVCILTGLAVGGIPETSMVSFITIFNLVHIPLEAISILMPLDRFVDRVRTMINIFTNTCGTLIVSRLSKLDKDNE